MEQLEQPIHNIPEWVKTRFGDKIPKLWLPKPIKEPKPVDEAKLAIKRQAMQAERAIIKEIRRKLKLNIVDKLGGKCQKCGYDKHKVVLTFHYLDPSLKEDQVSNMLYRAAYWLHKKQVSNCQPIIDEIKKCALLCPTCHAEEHLK